ncbi:polysaccharide biosynthesis C-terminal domain-containing protein [Rhizobium sp. TRM95796]|uniref:oligosaccharide flippase family protein n=1 Tax=Rhizobium sp. TRM95796 TaxID=2979862 RepID=UPI0021E79961|nr:polysaccharide biosynthesis C-terminal domain-containing protein [Rhizobium sp. TRM95796]MCV3766865.1 polysaccharide biosynthesis C-terminal domain-containing protein [Rhizobium sp. TRM95796]
MSKNIMANSMLNAAAGMLLLVTGFVCSIVAARLLGPEANGVIAFSLWFATTGALVAELGTGVLLMRMLPKLKVEGYDEKRRRGFAALLLTPTLISTVVLAALYGVIFLGSEELHWIDTGPEVALLTGGLFVLQSIGAFTKNYLIGEQRLGAFFKLTAIASVVQLTTVAAGAVFHGVEGALLGYAAGQAVMFLYTLTLMFERRDFCDTPAKFLVSSSLALSAGYVIDSVFLNRIEILFLQQFWDVKMVGFYAVSLSLANLALQLPVQLTGSLLPYYAAQRQSSNGQQMNADVFTSVIRALFYLTLPMSLGLAGVATPLVTSVFGEEFAPAGPMVALIALSAPAYVMMQILTQYLFSLDMMKSRLFAGLIGSVVIVVGCFVAVPAFGGEGAAIARLAAFTLMCMAMIRMTGFGKNLHGLYSVLAKVTIASALVGGVAYVVSDFVPGITGLVLAIAIGVVVYPVALRFTRAIPREDGAMLRALAGRAPGKAGKAAGKIVRWVAPRTLDASSPQPSLALEAPGAGRQAAHAVSFEGNAGLYQPEAEGVARRDAAVLLLSPWGFEELCSRKFYRILAEDLSEAGLPSLRFDYPGTGDSRDLADHEGMEAWEASIIAAAAKLRALTGLDRLILIGQGPGAALAQKTADQLGEIGAIVMLAPMLSGRLYLRETALMSTAIDQALGLREDQRDKVHVSIAGFKLPEAIATALKAINFGLAPKAAALHYLLLSKPSSGAEAQLGEALRQQGASADVEPFTGYETLVANPTIQVMPLQTIARIVDWALDKTGPTQTRSARPAGADTVNTDDYVETGLRFGDGERLHGILCEPVNAPNGLRALILSTAYDRASGWGRSGTDLARSLAKAGIASLRYDAANVGDSPPVSGATPQVLYSPDQIVDARQAIDVLEARLGAGPLILSGRCSGAYVALRTAHADPRVSAFMAVNPYTYYWDPTKPVDGALTFVPRSLDDYGQRLARVDTFKRLVKGDIDVPAAARNISLALYRRLLAKLKLVLRFIDSAGPVHHETVEMFRTYALRDTSAILAYSEGDVGVEALRKHFGDNGEKLAAFPNVKLVMIPDADHNLTPQAAKDQAMAELVELARLHAALK